ncbi:MAG: VCBS repeat-containing protein [Saprospirales bacterium]|nr:VCBS repeat-containing protein [Saprospirales bacterium]
MKKSLLLSFIALLGWVSCRESDSGVPDQAGPGVDTALFALLPPTETGIHFSNNLPEDDPDLNILKYRNFYNGGGIAIGDVNNDGLVDLFLTANAGPNKLYLNKGAWKFEDIAEKAGVAGKSGWSTGVTMADVNGDGWLDIYVCRAGPGNDRANELFINNKYGRFSEQARSYGLDDAGLGTHAAFFDYDRDGDLDMYLLNNSARPVGAFDFRQDLRQQRDPLGGHKLFRCDWPDTGGHPRFTDVSADAGILGSVIAFGMGVTVGDLDHDGWPDIYVSNDFFERDYLYSNNRDGTFTEKLEQSMRHISASSMGADMADLTNDGYPEIFVTDMLPVRDARIKTTTSFESPDRFRYAAEHGYYNQFMRNMLHLNNGDGTFSEIACLASLEATDWKQGALLFDMDNDGWKDVFVANGVAKDLTDLDYLSYASDQAAQKTTPEDERLLIAAMPHTPLANMAFQNERDFRFADRSVDWGLAAPGFSNGAAYGDLDNDGDLDLVVNNVNAVASVYRNTAEKRLPNANFLKIELEGAGHNTAAIGAKIFLRAQGQTFYQELIPVRGYQSAVDPRPNFGLGAAGRVDTLLVVWPTGNRATLLTGVPANQTLRLRQQEARHPLQGIPWLLPGRQPFFSPAPDNAGIGWKHRESAFYDWDRDRMLPFLYSTEGPRLATGDANGDGLDDFYAGGAAGQAGALMLQSATGLFYHSLQAAFAVDAGCEDTDAVFLDADADGDADLFVASGSNEAEPLRPELADRLYLNDGHGVFRRKQDAVPESKAFATGCVRAADWDGDGDLDLFAGMRLLPGKVGVPVGGYLLQNDGRGRFVFFQPECMMNLGLITDAVWADTDQDNDPDLLIAGEWMAPRLLRNDGPGSTPFKDISRSAGLDGLDGLWKRVAAADINSDGLPDFILGNNGLNSRLKARPDAPLTLYFSDFDNNGGPEQLLCRYESGKLLPYASRNDIIGNMPALKKKYLKFRQYASQPVSEIFSGEALAYAIKRTAGTLSSGVLLSRSKGKYTFKPFPAAAQFAPVFGIAVMDINGDGHPDVVSGGNFKGMRPEFGFVDADYGLLLLGDGQGNFRPVFSKDSGLRVDGELRDIRLIRAGGKPVLLLSRNNDTPLIFQVSTLPNQ